MMEMISLYLEQTPTLVNTMKQSLHARDWKSLYAAVHKLIPSFAIMGISPDFENVAKKVQEYASTQLQTDVIILDYHLDGIDPGAMNGVDTLDKIKAFNPDIPVVMLSSQDKIEVAVDCMHHKASDYVVKSETAFVRLKKTITTIFKYKKMEKELNWYMERM
jgi:DNA-binding NarL/FixJ family response regulator